MKPKVLELTKRFFSEKLGAGWENTPPVPLTGMEAIEVLWSLNDVFRPCFERIKTVKYRSRCESGADKAIETFAYHPSPEAWRDLTPCVWRVLLERHQQMIVVAAASEAQHNTRFMYLPQGLPESEKLPALMLFWLHSMELPFSAEDRSQLELPEQFSEVPMQLH